MKKLVHIAALLCALGALALAQTPDAGRSLAAPNQLSAQSAIDSALALEDPTARIAALERFLKTNSVPEQNQMAREALVASYAQRGEAQLADNNIERASAEFRRALAALPAEFNDTFFEETAIRIPLAVSVRGYRDEALALTRLLEARVAQEPMRLARVGEFYLNVEAPADAMRALEAAAKLTDGSSDASSASSRATLQRALGAAYRMSLRLDDAIAAYQTAIEIDAKDKHAYVELANLYRAHGAYADAAKLYRKQLALDPKSAASYKGLALALLAQGNQSEAEAALDKARGVRGAPEEVTRDLHLQTQLAFLYLAQNKLKEARTASDAALYIEPRYAWARIAAAEVELADGKLFEAERNLLAAKSYASFPSLSFALGKLYLTAEDFDGALEQFAKAITLAPDGQFTAVLGGALPAQAETLRELLAREHQASLFLAEAPTSDEQFKIAESLMRFNALLAARKPRIALPPAASRTSKTQFRPRLEDQIAAEQRAKQDAQGPKQEDALDRAAMSFVEAENSRRAFRMLYVAERLAQAGVATGLAAELAEQAAGLAEVATEFDGSVRDYPNYDRDGRRRIVRGRALAAQGWALFKGNQNAAAADALAASVAAYGPLPEGQRAKWRLATVKEAQGELKEALELYLSGYERPSGAAVDLNRALIEALYRKVNGSLEGLDRRIGAPPAALVANEPSSKPSTRPTLGQPRPPRAPARESLLKPARAASAPAATPPVTQATGDNAATIQPATGAPPTTGAANAEAIAPSEPTEAKPEVTPKSEPVETKPEAASKSESVESKPETTEKSEPVATKPEASTPTTTEPVKTGKTTEASVNETAEPRTTKSAAPADLPPAEPAATELAQPKLAAPVIIAEPKAAESDDNAVPPPPAAAGMAATTPLELPAFSSPVAATSLLAPPPTSFQRVLRPARLTSAMRSNAEQIPPAPMVATPVMEGRVHTRKRRVAEPNN